MRLIFLDVNYDVIGESNTISTLNNSWTLISETMIIPVQTRIIRVELQGTRNAGTDNDSYFDDLFVRIGTNELDCDNVTSTNNSLPLNLPPLEIRPNPMTDLANIYLAKGFEEDALVNVMDSLGNKVLPAFEINGRNLRIVRGDLPAGAYIIWLRSKNGVSRTAKLIVSGR